MSTGEAQRTGPAAPRPVAATGSGSVVANVARRFLRDRLGVAGLGWILLVTVVALLAPVLTPYDPSETSLLNKLQPPTAEHWLGTDHLGRDVLSRLISAARVSMSAAMLAVSVTIVLGLPAGLAAGYLGKRWDSAISRAADVLMSFPPLILALGVIAALGPGLTNAMMAVGVIYSPRVFRIARAATLSVREETFVEAAIATGCSTGRIVRRHVLPNVLSPVIVQVALLVSFAILAEASLSFLGFGVQVPQASWGNMLGQAFREIYRAPQLVYFPGVSIALTTVSFNFVGDALRDALGRETRIAT